MGFINLMATIFAGRAVKKAMTGKDPQSKDFQKTFDSLVKNLRHANELEKEIKELHRQRKIMSGESILSLEEIFENSIIELRSVDGSVVPKNVTFKIATLIKSIKGSVIFKLINISWWAIIIWVIYHILSDQASKEVMLSIKAGEAGIYLLIIRFFMLRIKIFANNIDRIREVILKKSDFGVQMCLEIIKRNVIKGMNIDMVRLALEEPNKESISQINEKTKWIYRYFLRRKKIVWFEKGIVTKITT